ncbi:BGP_1a_G0013750.mRNA.1.CDS.1 [Saccharomyces cerevisiae]|nr:BGP_1a_G0013750.mRNA.1.CDS.1 [Saccharomyces cerevisiae]CAI7095802.1 BGP_1a_G0013750.mRNA.1.CDS.1 [Saccharomyces cerevisiae]CAI7098824.1 ASN_collapsed_G0014650.mRNA.1.CDS.1 [Saccharomyces cerevisiae]
MTLSLINRSTACIQAVEQKYIAVFRYRRTIDDAPIPHTPCMDAQSTHAFYNAEHHRHLVKIRIICPGVDNAFLDIHTASPNANLQPIKLNCFRRSSGNKVHEHTS